MDIRSSNSLRRKNSKTRSSWIQSFRKLKNVITALQSNIHYNTVITIHVNPSIMDTSVSEANKMEKKLTFIKQEVSNQIHNQRTRASSKYYNTGSLAQPSTITKYQNYCMI
jgi:hypothetical protein